MSEPVQVTVSVELEPDQALALAQFTKRLMFSDIRDCAISDEDAYVMVAAIERLQRSLEDAGFAPR